MSLKGRCDEVFCQNMVQFRGNSISRKFCARIITLSVKIRTILFSFYVWPSVSTRLDSNEWKNEWMEKKVRLVSLTLKVVYLGKHFHMSLRSVRHFTRRRYSRSKRGSPADLENVPTFPSPTTVKNKLWVRATPRPRWGAGSPQEQCCSWSRAYT